MYCILGFREGYNVDIMHALQSAMGYFSINWMDVEPIYGDVDENGTFNGIIGMLQRNEGDLSTAGLTVTEERASAVDFTNEIIPEYVTLITNYMPIQPSINTMAYCLIFDWRVWVILFIICLAMSVTFGMTHSFKSYESAFAYVMTTMLQRGALITSHNLVIV